MFHSKLSSFAYYYQLFSSPILHNCESHPRESSEHVYSPTFQSQNHCQKIANEKHYTNIFGVKMIYAALKSCFSLKFCFLTLLLTGCGQVTEDSAHPNSWAI